MTKADIPMSEIALRILDADGEPAMWKFITSATPDTFPNQPDIPRAAHLADGSVVHLIDGTYTFQEHPLNTEIEKTRPSTGLMGQPPPAFQPVTPLFCWPSRQTLHQRVLEHLVDHAAEQLHASGQHTRVPDPAELFQQYPELPELLQGRRRQAITLQPLSTDLIDHLGAYVDNLADQIVYSMPENTRTSLLEQIAEKIAQLNGSTQKIAT